MSFVIPASIVVLLSTKTFGGAAHDALYSPWGWEPAQKTLLYFTLWGVKVGLLNVFKYWMTVQGFGISKEHYHLIIGPRSDWTGHEVDTLVRTYGKKKMKIFDAINRRSGHLLINIIRIVFYVYLCDTNELRDGNL